MVRKFALPVMLLTGALVVGVGCDSMGGKKKDDTKSSAKTTSGSKTLYERLGGEGAISAVVDDFVARAAADTRNVNFTRQGHPNQWDPSPANVAKLKRRLVEFIGMATGGPQKYTGRDMVTSHTGMNITESEFNALAGHLKASLDKFKVPQKEQDELIAIVATTKDQIVGK